MSLNNAAAIEEVEKDLYAACCQNELGKAKGTEHVMVAADLAMGRDNKLLRQIKETRNPRSLPPEPFAKIGAYRIKEHTRNQWCSTSILNLAS